MITEKQFNLETIEVSMLPELQGWKEIQETFVAENPFISIVDNKTYEEAKKARTALITARTTIKKQDELIASKLKDVRNKAGDFSAELIKITLPHEEKQQAEVRRYEALKEAERVAKEKSEQERKDAIVRRIEVIYDLKKSTIDNLTFVNIEKVKADFESNFFNTDVTEFEEFDLQFVSKIQLIKSQFDDKIEILMQKENQRIESEKLAKEKANFEAEKLAKEKADKIIDDKRIAEQKAINDANLKREQEIEAKQKEIDVANRKRQDELDAKQKAIDEADAKRKSEIVSEEKAKADAEAKAKLEAKQKAKEIADGKRIEELKPGVKKLEAWVNSFDIDQCPITEANSQANEIIKRFNEFKSWAKNEISNIK